MNLEKYLDITPELQEAISFAETSPLPEPSEVTTDVYA